MSEETEAAEGWAVDLLETELRRSYPDPLTKHELQVESGLSIQQMRPAFASLVERGLIEEENGSVVLTEEGYDAEVGGAVVAVAGGQAIVENDDDLMPEDDPDAEEAAATVAASLEPPIPTSVPDAAPGDTRYEVDFTLQVGFRAEVREGETEDDAARRDAREIALAASEGVRAAFPGLTIGDGTVTALRAYDRPRTL